MFKTNLSRAIPAPTFDFRQTLWTGVFLAASMATASAQTITFQGNQLPCISYNISTAQNLGAPPNLTRTTDPQRIAQNRAAACTSAFRNAVAAINQLHPNNRVSCDEYPFASSNQGGNGSQAMIVPLAENNSQGGQLSAFYNQNNIVNNSPYRVATANVPPANQLPLFAYNGLQGCAAFGGAFASTKPLHASEHRVQYGQVGLWDAADPSAYPIGKGPLPWYGPKGIVIPAADTLGKTGIRVSVTLAAAPPIPSDSDAPTNIITVGRSGIVVGNIPAASTAKIAIAEGRYRVDFIHKGAHPEDSTDVHFVLSPWTAPSAN